MQITKLDCSYSDKVIDLIRSSDKNFSWSDSQIINSLNNDIAYGSFESNVIRGIAIFQQVFETVELLYICVSNTYKNQGVGYTLLRKCIDDLSNASEVESIFLEVAVDNIKAIKLYEKLGFKNISVRKKYYKRADGSFCDAIIYNLKLD